MYVVSNDSQMPELTVMRITSFPATSSPDFRLTCKGIRKLYRTERILIKQIPYKAENKAFSGKGDTSLFQEKTWNIIIENVSLVSYNQCEQLFG